MHDPELARFSRLPNEVNTALATIRHKIQLNIIDSNVAGKNDVLISNIRLILGLIENPGQEEYSAGGDILDPEVIECFMVIIKYVYEIESDRAAKHVLRMSLSNILKKVQSL